jgi:NTP pyrophosphatase (non-canonical NTP hydrolase)
MTHEVIYKPKNINKLVEEAHKNAVEHGWWEEERSFGEQIALMHSELSEALEEYRNGKGFNQIYYSEKIYCRDKPEGIPIELADAVIRIFDTCGKYGIDLEKAIEMKMAYNRTRSYKHGGKKI